MTSRFLGLMVLAGLSVATPVAAQQLVNLPPGSWANDVTPDGEIVVGSYSSVDGFIWRWRVDPAPTVVPGGVITGVSDDASVLCGDIADPNGSGLSVAAVWTQATGWQSLGTLPGAGTSCGNLSSALGISDDGTAIVGLAWDNGCEATGFRWTAAAGMQPLQLLSYGGGDRCSAISGDGSVMGGFGKGTAGRTPAYWSPTGAGVILNPNIQGEVYGFNHDGSKSVGTRWFAGGNYSAFILDRQTGVFTNLGQLSSTWAAAASDLSDDASVIVGFDYFSLSRKAWVWTASDGIISLNDRLSALGIAGAPALQVCRAVSADGSVIVGGAGLAGGALGSAGFIVEIPKTKWTNLGHGLAGTNGMPKLVGTGTLVAASTTNVTLTQGKPLSPAALVLGMSNAQLPFKQGVLAPFPNWIFSFPALSGAGSLSLSFKWPGGMPGGFSMYWQFLVSDPSAPAGIALSNALKSRT